ncbi:MAG: MlaD family protein [Planctomycetota bacterium]
MNESNPTPPPASSLPAAVPVRRRRLPFAWVLPLLGLAVVGYFAYWAYTQNEPNVTLRLDDASGIKAFQTPVRCRGVEVGTVTDVALSPNGNGATVSIRLNASGLPLATPDSDWWVLRPEFSITDVSGVESLLAGPSIEYRPGDKPELRNKSFTALSGPPPDAGMRGGLRLFITSDHRDAVEPGTLVRFRGIPIGRVISMRLPTHGQSVVLIAEIDLPFAHLIRENSVFWHRKRAVANLSSVSLGLGGYQIDFPRLNSALDISIDVATPDKPGELVEADTIFKMQHTPPDDFDTWSPNLIPVEEPAPTPEDNKAAETPNPDDPAPKKPDPLGDIFNFINPFD